MSALAHECRVLRIIMVVLLRFRCITLAEAQLATAAASLQLSLKALVMFSEKV